jgi:hypothetical protein
LPNCHRSNGAYVNVRACEYTFKAGNAQDKVSPVCATLTSWARDVTEAGKNSDAFGVVFMLHHSTLAACVNIGCFFFCQLLPFLIGCFFSCHLLPFLIGCFFSWTGAVAAPDGRPGSTSFVSNSESLERRRCHYLRVFANSGLKTAESLYTVLLNGDFCSAW